MMNMKLSRWMHSFTPSKSHARKKNTDLGIKIRAKANRTTFCNGSKGSETKLLHTQRIFWDVILPNCWWQKWFTSCKSEDSLFLCACFFVVQGVHEKGQDAEETPRSCCFRFSLETLHKHLQMWLPQCACHPARTRPLHKVSPLHCTLILRKGVHPECNPAAITFKSFVTFSRFSSVNLPRQKISHNWKRNSGKKKRSLPERNWFVLISF